ncbi:lantibiotic dehydratase [Arcicella sp. DC2W]|uniref:Lantibiotic dehydratase n=1 Tax=Arcicella gelida TaxID=2984195 RepID=A0ABU5S384_9BACT|nr:lantibiotic dehydratase [Arcicella sp. DC2W]MEA5402900.1 lantibiotic dehydratase [Arcicella sp. DC2W]
MNYSFFNQFIVRTPLYSIEKLQVVLSQNSLEVSMNALFNFFQEPINQEALFLASPDLKSRLLDYYKGEIKEQTKVKALAYSLMKYFQRMTTRCTPFGLFAGIGVGDIKSNTNIIIDTQIAKNRHTRLDMNYLCALATAIVQIDVIQEEIKFYVNNSIYLIGEEVRYVEYHYHNTRRIHQISSVDFSEYLQKIFEVAKSGATKQQLSNAIINDQISQEEADIFINEIITSQLLVSQLEPSVCGEEFIFQLINTLKELPSDKSFTINEQVMSIGSLVQLLISIQEKLDELDNSEYNDVHLYLAFAENLKQLGIEIELGKLFQTDFVRKSDKCTLDEAILTDIVSTARFLNKISIKYGETKLEKFAKAFYERYEDAEIPLLYALDVETGIGYIQSNDNPDNNKNKISWSKLDEILLNKILQSKVSNTFEITLIDEDFKDFKENWDDQQDTIGFMVELLKDSGGQIKTVMSNGGGSSAGNILGRFCHASQDIDALVRSIITKEDELKSSDTILAEIVHLPESRTGNILMRPTIRNYEIPYLAKASVSDEFQISPDDLYISVRRSNVFLRSKKLNKIIIPRLTNAHNFGHNSLPIYNFLCDLQTQHSRGGVSFNWGALENNYNFLPRVNYKQSIISPAKWILRKDTFEHLLKIEDNEQLMKGVQDWKSEWKMPNIIQLVDFDNELLVDLQNILSTKTFLNTIKKRDFVQLTEFLFNKDNCLITDSDNNHYVNQFVIAFYRNEKLNKNESLYELPQIINTIPIKRSFITGEDWLYFKIYCGAKTADQILKYGLTDALRQLRENGLIKKWFFIRYTDPKNHLRVRFEVTDTFQISEVIKILKGSLSYFLDNKLIWKTQTDTYNRELERYGASSIEFSESLFQLSSEQIIQFLEILNGEDEVRDNEISWFFGLKTIDMLLDSFKFDIYAKKDLLENLSENFGREFNMNLELKKQIGERFRKERNTIVNCLKNEYNLDDDFKTAFNILHQSKIMCDTIAQSVLRLHQTNLLETPLSQLLSSYIHMIMNRLFTSNQRHTEMIQYHLLWHFYRSEIAQRKKLD